VAAKRGSIVGLRRHIYLGYDSLALLARALLAHARCSADFFTGLLARVVVALLDSPARIVARADSLASKLDLTLATTSNESKNGSFTIRFGPHTLSTSFEVRD
jgi:hypothetical protein